MDENLLPPDGDMVDASDFWARRNQAPTGADAAADQSAEAAADSVGIDGAAAGSADHEDHVCKSGGWVGPPFRDYLTDAEPLTIRRLLVANRGEIACRVFRTAQRLGIETVAVFSEPDRDAEHVRSADIAVALGGVTSTESYLDGSKVIAAAVKVGADAIHPGYGFLSENPDFAEAVEFAGLTWVGPTPASIRSMALKVEAKRIAAAAGVPLVPGAELAADVSNPELRAIAEQVGYPLLVKASAGGGGKGMRVVLDAETLIEAVETARREALNSFGDATVFFERYLPGARHVEVQVFGDQQGNVVHLFERECSIQRRHQKIVEESPSPGSTQTTLDRMYASAVSLADQIGYVGAGTVEFLVFGDGADQEFYFLEMNTRLQVEHPVTESVTGLDLVEWQLGVASGRRLPFAQAEIRRHGHAIEVRLYAEDPANHYLPSTGVLSAFSPGSVIGSRGSCCRIDTGFAAGDVVSPFYDPMLAKVIAHGDNRDHAAATLASFLRSFDIAGVVTNRDSLIAILESQPFLAGQTPTDFLVRHPELLDAPVVSQLKREELIRAAAVASFRLLDHRAPWRQLAFSGWGNVAVVPQRIDFGYWQNGAQRDVAAVIAATGPTTGRIELRDATAAAGFSGEVAGVEYRITSEPCDESDDLFRIHRIELAGLARRYEVGVNDTYLWVNDGVDSLTLRRLPRFADPDDAAAAGGSTAPVPGTVVAIEVLPGDEVSEGQTLVVLEAMKMEHRIVAGADGVVTEVHVSVGESVDAHQKLVTIE